jgi:hypothetical protein
VKKTTLTLAVLALALVATGPVFAAHVNVYSASFQLDPTQEVPLPPASGDALGSCVAILDLEADPATLHLSCTHNVPSATAAHIHLGDRGESGPIVFPLPNATSPIVFETELTAEQVAAFVVGDYYVNVHNAANPQGIIRGQIEFDAQEDAASLSVGSFDDVAACRAVISERTGDTDVRLTCTTDFDATAVEIRVDGGPAIAMFTDPEMLNEVFTLTDAQADLLRNGDLNITFINAMTTQTLSLDGCFADTNTLCLNDNRFAVTVSGSAPDGSGGTNPFTGRAFARTDSSGEFSFFTADNLEILVKVINGCPVNDRYWVFFSATTNVAFTLTVTDTVTGDSINYANPQGMIALPVADTDAFDTCMN